MAAILSERYANLDERARRAWLKLSFGTAARAAFYATMADAAEADIAPYQILRDILAVSQRHLLRSGLAQILRSALPVVERGLGIPAAIRDWVPPREYAMLAASERGGPKVLCRAFSELSELLTKQAEVKRKLMTAGLTNLALLLVIVGVIATLAKTLVPVMSESTDAASARAMPFAVAYFHACTWLLHNGVYLIAVALALVVACFLALPNWTGRVRAFFDQYIPPFSIYQRMRATTFLSSTAALLRVGVTLSGTLEDLSKSGSRWMRHHVDAMRSVLDTGGGAANAIAAGPLPNATADQLRIYHSIPNFQDVMTRLSKANFETFVRSVTTLSYTFTGVVYALAFVFGASTVVAIFQFADAIQAAAHSGLH